MTEEMQIEEIAALESANYAALRAWVQATPGSSMVVRDDLILTRALFFPMPDFNHACLLRATPAGVDPLIDDIVAHFRRIRRRVHVFVSPACLPAGVGERLLARGFERQEREEPWLRCDLRGWVPPPVGSDAVRVVTVGPEEARTFACVYLASFGMAAALAPVVAPLMKRLMRVPSTRYALAMLNGRPAGVCLWHTEGDVVALGGMGVLPPFRGSRVATTLGMHLMVDAQAEGKRTVVVQMINPGFEGFVAQYGFRRVFTRVHYVLPG